VDLADIRRRRLVQAVHRRGERVLHELLAEIDRVHMVAATTDRLLERYAALDIDVLAVTGGDRFPPLVLHTVASEDAHACASSQAEAAHECFTGNRGRNACRAKQVVRETIPALGGDRLHVLPLRSIQGGQQ